MNKNTKSAGPSLATRKGWAIDAVKAAEAELKAAHKAVEVAFEKLDEECPGIMATLAARGHVAADKEGNFSAVFVPHQCWVAAGAPASEGPQGWRELANCMHWDFILKFPVAQRRGQVDRLMKNAAEIKRRTAFLEAAADLLKPVFEAVKEAQIDLRAATKAVQQIRSAQRQCS